LTVIILAYDRREFIVDAVSSAANQSLPRDSYEIIVVRNFEDAEIEAQLRTQRAKTIRLGETGQGSWILAAAKEAVGNILVFLDDDDLFEPTKLETVVSMFHADEDLGYYHNGVQHVGKDGSTPISTKKPQRLGGRPPSQTRLSSGPHNIRAVSEAWWTGAAFNLSSISLRREIILDAAAPLQRVHGGAGAFLFYAALLSRFEIVIDPRPLTNYRVHAGNRSGYDVVPSPEKWTKQMRFVRDGIRDAQVVLDLIRDRQADPRLGRPLIVVLLRSEVLLGAVDSSVSRAWVLSRLLRLATASFPNQLWSGMKYFMMGTLRLASPTWSRKWLGVRDKAPEPQNMGPPTISKQ
jgi:glycosyltransferase involved in cell wall biosynthesis